MPLAISKNPVLGIYQLGLTLFKLMHLVMMSSSVDIPDRDAGKNRSSTEPDSPIPDNIHVSTNKEIKELSKIASM